MVGVLRSSVEELKALSRNMEEVVIIDLDDDRVIPPGSETDAALLPPFVEPLRNTIEEISKRTRGRVTLTGIAKKGKVRGTLLPHLQQLKDEVNPNNTDIFPVVQGDH